MGYHSSESFLCRCRHEAILKSQQCQPSVFSSHPSPFFVKIAFKLALKNRPRVLQIPLSIRLRRRYPLERLVEFGDDALLLGEWRELGILARTCLARKLLYGGTNTSDVCQSTLDNIQSHSNRNLWYRVAFAINLSLTDPLIRCQEVPLYHSNDPMLHRSIPIRRSPASYDVSLRHTLYSIVLYLIRTDSKLPIRARGKPLMRPLTIFLTQSAYPRSVCQHTSPSLFISHPSFIAVP